MNATQLATRRRKTALAAAKKLEEATTALRAFLMACNDCHDESASLTLQGKGIDGREILIGNMSEYSTYLSSRYEKADE